MAKHLRAPLFDLLMKASGWEVPRAEKKPATVYFGKVTNEDNEEDNRGEDPMDPPRYICTYTFYWLYLYLYLFYI